ncbi:nucleotidyltransferase domain-containing protein [Spirosoma sp.]|nr:nucleotidyltransferase domain-containing protein [Spirosoma sp.]MCX6213477.1 nucleotidyltransferase domain-containing protein [Spirosoma sp.]
MHGSRARGDARPNSDWDFLVFTNNDLSGGEGGSFRIGCTTFNKRAVG